MNAVLDLGSGVLTGVLAAIIVAGLGALPGILTHFGKRRTARKRWPFEGGNFKIVLATSTNTDTGKYLRPSTGVGQVRGLATLVPSIYRAWGKKARVSDVKLSDQVSGSEHADNLVILGGPKNNELSEWFLNRLNESRLEMEPPKWEVFGQRDSVLNWGDRYFAAKVEVPDDSHENNRSYVTVDYGLVVRWRNPANRDKTVILLTGASTYGTIAAALWYVGQGDRDSKAGESRIPSHESFAALVSSRVTNGYVERPKLLYSQELAD